MEIIFFFLKKDFFNSVMDPPEASITILKMGEVATFERVYSIGPTSFFRK